MVWNAPCPPNFRCDPRKSTDYQEEEVRWSHAYLWNMFIVQSRFTQSVVVILIHLRVSDYRCTMLISLLVYSSTTSLLTVTS